MTCGKIIGVGRNYSEHIKEMASARTREPVLFLKPSTAVCRLDKPLIIPPNEGSVHHEVELAVAIGRQGAHIDEQEAASFVAGYAIGLDLTLRDKQAIAKEKGLPWAVAKGFDLSCPLSEFVLPENVPDPGNLKIGLWINGIQRQQGNTNQMIFSVPFLIHYISHYFTLQAGDVIMTGTPSGVGPLHPGDKLELEIEHIAHIHTRVAG